MVDFVHCTRLMANPLHAYGYLRSGRSPEIGDFRTGPLRFRARKQDWLAIKEVLVLDEYACVDRVLDGISAPRILDIGANIGCFALRSLSAFPGASVASVEAASDTFEILAQNRALNPGCDWQVLNRGVWGSQGPLTIVRRGLALAHRVVEGVGDDAVQGITLQALVESLAWPRVDLIKIDIEGGEESVVPAAADVLRECPALLVEVHTDRIDAAPVLATLHSVYRHAWQLNDRLSAKPLYLWARDAFDLPRDAVPIRP
jgi:FkbM family methyltransferase